jgi:large subunit ribosomal protein L19e
MSNLVNQKRMAAEMLKCGLRRIHIDPEALEDVGEAVTRQDIRGLIKDGAITKMQKKGISSARHKYIRAQKAKRKRKGQGSRKGKKGARLPKKRRWIRTIRPIRDELRKMREQGVIGPTIYRRYYMRAKGGLYRSRAHLRAQMDSDGAFSAPDSRKAPLGAPSEKES